MPWSRSIGRMYLPVTGDVMAYEVSMYGVAVYACAEERAFAREAVEVRRRRAGVAVSAHVVGAQGVDGHEQEVAVTQVERAHFAPVVVGAARRARGTEAGSCAGRAFGRRGRDARGKLDCPAADGGGLQHDPAEVIEAREAPRARRHGQRERHRSPAPSLGNATSRRRLRLGRRVRERERHERRGQRRSSARARGGTPRIEAHGEHERGSRARATRAVAATSAARREAARARARATRGTRTKPAAAATAPTSSANPPRVAAVAR